MHFETIGQRIKNTRLLKKLSLVSLSSLSGISRQTLSIFEHDKKLPKLNDIIKISKALNVSIDYLCKGLNEEKSIKDEYEDLFQALFILIKNDLMIIEINNDEVLIKSNDKIINSFSSQIKSLFDLRSSVNPETYLSLLNEFMILLKFQDND